MPTGRPLGARLFRLPLTLLLAVIWCGAFDLCVCSPARADEPAAAARPSPPPPEELDHLFAAVKAAQKLIPRETFDPQAVIDAAGKHPAGLFEWVRDRTHWVPYRGALRGPVGMLMDRTGNALDRSLLLAELLRRAGQNVRLARATLSEEQAKECLSRVRPAPPAALPTAVAHDNETLAQLAKAHQLDETLLKEETEAIRSLAEALLKDAAARQATQSDSLLEALGPVPPTDEASATAGDVSAIADHWWVQYQDKGKWIDLDPLLPDAKPGETRLVPKETIPIRAADGTVHLDAKYCQEVEVRVIVERRTGGKLNEEVVLKHVLRPSDLIGQRVSLRHVPVQWPKQLDLSKESDPAARLRAELPKLTEWMPVLVVGARVVKGKVVRTTGETRNASGALPGGLQSGGGFGILGGGGAPADQGEFTAQWIDYLIRVPGQPPRAVRREGFDLLGPVARAAGQAATAERLDDAPEIPGLYLLDQTDIVLQNGRWSGEFFADLMLGTIIKEEPRLRSLAAVLDPVARQRQIMPVAERLFGVSPLLLTVGINRFAMDSAPAVYLASPNVLCYRRGTNFGSNGQAVYEGVIDLAINEVAVLPTARAAAFKVRARQGVADTVAEGIPSGNLQPYGNVSRLFEWAADNNIAPVVVRGADDALLQNQELPPDAAARMRASLADGCVLVAPQRPIVTGDDARTGWWRVHATTGDCVGVMDTGYHQDTVDNMAIITEASLPAAGITVITPAAGASGSHLVLVGCLGSACGWISVGAHVIYSLHQEKEQLEAEVERLRQEIRANRRSYEPSPESKQPGLRRNKPQRK